MLQVFNNTRKIMNRYHTKNEKITEISYRIAYQISLHGEAYTMGENLIKPILNETITCFFDDQNRECINQIPLSNNTISRRVIDIAKSIENELILRLHSCKYYSIQMDESTDVSGLAILLVFVRYDFNNSIENNLLLCQELKLKTTGENIFNCINDYISINNIDWNKCVSVCTDGAKSMLGNLSGAVTRIKEVAKNCSGVHCILHRYALVTKKIPESLKNVLDEAVKIINFIKNRPLQTRIFKKLCEDMNSQHKTLLFHTEVRWLSRGNVLMRLVELRKELITYFSIQKFELSERLQDKEWVTRLIYLASIFSKLNETCLYLQKEKTNICRAHECIVAFSRKLCY